MDGRTNGSDICVIEMDGIVRVTVYDLPRGAACLGIGPCVMPRTEEGSGSLRRMPPGMFAFSYSVRDVTVRLVTGASLNVKSFRLFFYGLSALNICLGAPLSSFAEANVPVNHE